MDTLKISHPQSDLLVRNNLWSFFGSLVSNPDSRNFYSLIYIGQLTYLNFIAYKIVLVHKLQNHDTKERW